MKNYGYEKIHADKSAQKIVTQSKLLKTFYDNSFTNKLPLRDNFRIVFGNLDIFLVYDSNNRTAWFISQPENKIVLTNYFREALAFVLNKQGIHLSGSTVRLTPVGWQNLYDLLSNDFFKNHDSIKRVEILTLIPGVRWHQPTLGLGVTFLNMKEFKEIVATVETAMRSG